MQSCNLPQISGAKVQFPRLQDCKIAYFGDSAEVRSVIAWGGVCSKQVGFLVQARVLAIVLVSANAVNSVLLYTGPLLMIRYPVCKGPGLADIEEAMTPFSGIIDCALGKNVDGSYCIECLVTGINFKTVRVVLHVKRYICDLGHDRTPSSSRETK